jgi:D-alanine-D-alanine ligase
VRIAFCHNLKTGDSLEEAEFDTPETVARITRALAAAGHQVHPLDVSAPLSVVAARLEALAPELVFNTAEGRRGRMREAFFPSLFEHLALPYTGSGGYGCTLTLDKDLTKRRMAEAGVPVLPSVLITAESFSAGKPERPRLLQELRTLDHPVFAKPNFEGSGKGISEASVFQDAETLEAALDDLLHTFPEGILVEPFIAGRDATVGFLSALDPPVLEPTGYRYHPDHQNRYNIYGYHLKNHAPEGAVEVVVGLELPPGLAEELMRYTAIGARVLGMEDLGRLDFRIAADGRAYFLEANALPSLEEGAGFLLAAERRGLSYDQTIQKVVESACRRWGIDPARSRPRLPTVALVYNLKRSDTHQDDREAEYDSPKTIALLRGALESLGNRVAEAEADSSLSVRLPALGADLVFNIAEGNSGRNREAQVPALCELLEIPYTGSDPATLSICLDKALAKRLLLQAGVPTPRFALLEDARDSLPPELRFPLIAKPNAEGTSKGLGPDSVVDGLEALRSLVRRLITRYRQPVIVEEYITGREFTVGLVGYPRPRLLPVMEVVFHGGGDRPVYGYGYKQDFSKEVTYRCPADLDPAALSRLEAAARDAFQALGCRDVARIDLRVDCQGSPYVLEVNPLPGLTPGFSDLCLISEAAGMSYPALVAEILAGARARGGSTRNTSAGSGGTGIGGRAGRSGSE